MTQDWLPRALEESRARGFLGPQPIAPQIAHALGFALSWESMRSTPPSSFLDLGSGGGIPGLVLLDRWRTNATLLDSMTKRGDFLREVLGWPDAPPNGEVIVARAEEAARWPELDGVFDLVTARSFGQPSVTAECAVRFLKVGGLLIVSEPPAERGAGRWDSAGLSRLGLVAARTLRFHASFQALEKVRPTDREFPRSSGTPKKRPLF